MLAAARKRNGIGENYSYRPKAERYRWVFSLAALCGSVSVEFPPFAALPFSYRPGGGATASQDMYEAGEAIRFHFLWRSKLHVNLPPKVLRLKKHVYWELIGGTQLEFT